MMLLFLERPSLLPWSVARAKVDRKPGLRAWTGALSLATAVTQQQLNSNCLTPSSCSSFILPTPFISNTVLHSLQICRKWLDFLWLPFKTNKLQPHVLFTAESSDFHMTGDKSVMRPILNDTWRCEIPQDCYNQLSPRPSDPLLTSYHCCCFNELIHQLINQELATGE